MGRWAQARRRGSAAPPTVVLGPPPAPVLSREGNELLQQATGLDDTDGTLQLWESMSGLPPWIMISQDAWSAAYYWSDTLLTVGRYYRVTETGNGIVYAGVSDKSESVYYA